MKTLNVVLILQLASILTTMDHVHINVSQQRDQDNMSSWSSLICMCIVVDGTLHNAICVGVATEEVPWPCISLQELMPTSAMDMVPFPMGEPNEPSRYHLLLAQLDYSGQW